MIILYIMKKKRGKLVCIKRLQVVSLGGPNALEIYGEYAPYTFYTDPQDMINICLSGEAPGEYLPGMKKLKEKELGNV